MNSLVNNLVNNRKFKILLAAISLFLLIDLIQDTYAKYISSSGATGNFTIARWSFLVNGQDILNGQSFSTTIVPTFDSNVNIKDGVLAPTSTGSFEIVINSTNVDVSFDQVITLAKDSTNTVGDLVFLGYKKNNDAPVSLNNANTATITSTQLLSNQNKTNTYTIYIGWMDGQGETMNNAADTLAANNGVAKVSVTLQFTQKATTPSP